MTTVLITYRLHEHHLGTHLQALRRVQHELRTRSDLDVTWHAYRDASDPTAFVDLVTTDRPGQLSTLRAWTSFRDGLDARCRQPPRLVELLPAGG